MRTTPAAAGLGRAITRAARLPRTQIQQRSLWVGAGRPGRSSLSNSQPAFCPCPSRTFSAAAHQNPTIGSPASAPSSPLSSSIPSPLLPRLQSKRYLTPKRFARNCSCTRMRLHESEGASGSMDITMGREVLPPIAKPTAYKVVLEPVFDGFTFNGDVSTKLDILQDTKDLFVNSLEIKIKEVTLSFNGKTLKAESTSYAEETQTDKFTFAETLPAGAKVELHIKYVGELNDKMAGFYRSSYKDENGETKWMATTQFEPTDARRAVPCFDQPDLKASWEVSLIADEKLTCLSNMDVKEEKSLGNGKKEVHFNPTPPMSTYLLAFIVADLRYKETNEFRLPIRVYTTPGNEKHADFALEVAAKTLKLYEETFDVKYPLPKVDQVAIPDFAAGAMENWGLITYRVVDLLYDPATASIDRKQRIAEVVQHELAHQWFGNLVTMDFWEGLWLNEGFATWMSWYSMDKFYPQWKVWENYVVDNLAGALSLDGLRSSHPIEVPVKKVAEINQIFDSISYAKGSSVLRMISKYLGEDIFMKGIRAYLKKHAYGNTVTTDLWAALSEASGKDVEGAMTTWTKKTGYPVIKVTEDGNKLHLKQNRYLKTADVKPEEDETLWPIFVGLRTAEGVNEDITFTGREHTLELKSLDFYKINADQTNVYRTLYTPERLKKLGQDAKTGKLTVEDRAGMLGDAGALATSGYQKTSALLDLVSGFTEEQSYIAWCEVIGRINAVKNAWLFGPEEMKKALRQFTKDLVAPVAHRVGWDFKEGEDDMLQQLKALVFLTAGLAGDEKVVAAAKEMFAKFAAGDADAINPNIRGAVYGIVLEYGENHGEKEWETVLNAYRNGRTSDERNVALRWMGRSKNPENIKKTLQFALSAEVKDQDIYQPISGVRAHAEGVVALWEWFKTNYDLLIKKLPPGLSMLGSVIGMCVSNFTTWDQLKDAENFFKDKDTTGFDRSLAQAMDSIKAKATWTERDTEDVNAWLKEKKYL